jgi:hypothetical protein
MRDCDGSPISKNFPTQCVNKGIEMKTLIHACILTLCVFTGAASADTFFVESPTVGIAATNSRAKALSLAEQNMARLSGLDRLSMYQRTDRSSVAYEHAKLRYDELVASPQFALLVGALERNPGLEIVGR